MVEGSQHTLQIMEAQTRFDLNAAIEKWRLELAAQPNLGLADQRELEAHLRDTVAELQQRGLNEEESFWLAGRRLGQPQQLNKEFAKTHPANSWRERLLWVLAAFLAWRLWNGIAMVTMGFVSHLIHKTAWANGSFQFSWFAPDFVRFYLPSATIQISRIITSPITRALLCFAPIVWLAASLARGRAETVSYLLQFVFKSRRWFAMVAGGFLGFYWSYTLLLMNSLTMQTPSVVRTVRISPESVVDGWLMPLFLIALIVWLMPPENRKISRGA